MKYKLSLLPRLILISLIVAATCVTVLPAASVSAASTRYVATTGSDDSNCTTPGDPCASIAYAVSQATIGDTVEIAAGTYTEFGIPVNKNLTIKGADAATTTVQATNDPILNPPNPSLSGIFNIQSPGSTLIVTIENLTIRYGSDEIGGGIYANDTELTINNSVITQNIASWDGGGIYIWGTLNLNNSIISDNISDSGGGGIVLVGNGAFVNSRITGNTTSTGGGGISASGDPSDDYFGYLTLDGVTVSDNFSSMGGGILNSNRNTLTINNSTISGNTAGPVDNVSGYTGGGIHNQGVLNLNSSVVNNNSASSGGGVFNLSNTSSYGTAYLYNSTISGNSAVKNGGGILNGTTSSDATVTLNFSTIANNISDSDNNGDGGGGGIRNNGKIVSINSLILGNKNGPSGTTHARADCWTDSTIRTQGHNLFGNGTGCGFSVSSGSVGVVQPDLVFTTLLGPLANNGGLTQTHALLNPGNNRAQNIIPDGDYNCGADPFDEDQRGDSRPSGSLCDIGAYEIQEAPIYRPVNDFDGDGKTDPAKFDSSNVLWQNYSSTNTWAGTWLGPGSFNVVARSDFDGDGKTDAAKFTSSSHLLEWQRSSDATWGSLDMGAGTYTIVPGGDYDGDNKTDPAKFDTATGVLWWYQSSTSTWASFWLGNDAYTIVASSDFDGDGKTDPAKFTTGTQSLWWYASTTSTWQGFWLGNGAMIVLEGSDFDGDGITDPAKYDVGSQAVWWWSSQTPGWDGAWLGTGTLTPLTASDFDGDHKTDPAKFDQATRVLWWFSSLTHAWDGLWLGEGTYTIVN